MTDAIGKNTPNAEKLRSYIDRLERIDAQKKQLTEDAKAIRAEAKADGFDVTHGINYVMKVRKMKPHDRQNAEDTRDIYLHAMDMLPEPPLFRTLATMVKDAASEAQVTEALKSLAPASGDIIMRMGSKQLRIYRDKDGKPHTEDYTPPDVNKSQSRSTLPPATKKDVPNCSADEAEALGRQAAKDNEPVINNPFPYDDARRPRWDLGWRKETGNDGMEPDDK
jgi:uncharacterized protein (UPF0335 family)